MELIGVIPAAGKATRMNGIDKFLLPCPEGNLLRKLIQAMRATDTRAILIQTSPDTYNAVSKSMDGYGLYAGSVNSRTMSETVGKARTFCQDYPVLFGMPDSYWEDPAVFDKLTLALEGGADLAVGIWETRPDQRDHLGMCDVDLTGMQVAHVEDKPKQTDLIYAWGALAWRPSVWKYLNPATPHVGYVINPAIQAGLNVRAVPMGGGYWDCGTPAEYWNLCRTF